MAENDSGRTEIVVGFNGDNSHLKSTLRENEKEITASAQRINKKLQTGIVGQFVSGSAGSSFGRGRGFNGGFGGGGGGGRLIGGLSNFGNGGSGNFICNNALFNKSIFNKSGFSSSVFNKVTIRSLTGTHNGSQSGGGWFSRLFGGRNNSRGGGLGGFLNRGIRGSNSLSGLTSAIGSLGPAAAAATIGITALATAVRGIIKMGTLIDNTKQQLSVMLGNEASAVKMLKKATRFSKDTPFEPDETYAATNLAVQFGIDPFKEGAYGLKKGQHFMQLAGGLASMMNLRGENIGLNRMVSGLLAGDRRLLKPVGGLVYPAWNTAKQFGEVGSHSFNIKLIEELGKIPQIMELARVKANSVEGLWSTIAGYVEEVWGLISGAGEESGVETLWSHIRSIFLDIRTIGGNIIDYMGPYFREWGATLGAELESVWKFLKAIFVILSPILKITVQIGRIINEFVKLGFNLLSILFEWLQPIQDVQDGFSGLNNIIDTLIRGVLFLQMEFAFFAEYVKGFLNSFSIRGFSDMFSDLIEKIDPSENDKIRKTKRDRNEKVLNSVIDNTLSANPLTNIFWEWGKYSSGEKRFPSIFNIIENTYNVDGKEVMKEGSSPAGDISKIKTKR